MILTFWLRQSISCQPFFNMKDLGEASYVLGIKILHDRANGMMLKLSQRTYIEKTMKRFNMQNCSSIEPLVVKDYKFFKGLVSSK